MLRSNVMKTPLSLIADSPNLATHIRETNVEAAVPKAGQQTGKRGSGTSGHGSGRGRNALGVKKNGGGPRGSGSEGTAVGRRSSTRSFFSAEERSSGRHGSGSATNGMSSNIALSVSSGAKEMAKRLGLNSQRLKELQQLHNKNTIGSGALVSVANVLQDGARATVSVVAGGSPEEKVRMCRGAKQRDELKGAFTGYRRAISASRRFFLTSRTPPSLRLTSLVAALRSVHLRRHVQRQLEGPALAPP